jgi:PAS domain S-box-containing protein
MAVAGAIVLFAGILLAWLFVGGPDQGFGPSYVLPVAVAATYALLGGLLGHFVERSRRAQQQLEETESEYRVLLERVPAIVYTAGYGPMGQWSYVSPKVEPILGYTVQEWTSRPDIWYERLHPDDRQQALAAEERSKSTGEELDSEYRLSAKDGRVLWFRDQATVVHDEQGRPLMLQGVMLDITSRKRAEDELELRYAVQKGLADAASLNEGLHGVLRTVAARFGWKLGAFWTLDEREEHLKLSDMWHAEDIPGYHFETVSRELRFHRDEGLPGRAWAAREPVWLTDTLTESNVARLEAAEACGLRSAVACPVMSGNHVRGVMEFFGPESRPVDPDVLSLLPPVCALLADFVTTRATIEEHRGRFQAVLDNAPAVVFAKDLKGAYLFVNQRLEQVTGLPAEQIEGRTNYDLFPTEVADMLSEHDRAVLDSGRQQEFEEVIPHEDGLHTYLTMKFPLRDALGTIYAVCGISTDVTELKRVQSELDERAELERSTRAKSAFLSRVSHELRTPLNAILGFGQVLEVDALTDRQRNSVHQIMRGGRHLLELVNDLLEISRIESGQLSVSLGIVDVAQAVHDIVLMMEPLADERAVTVSHQSGVARPLALADEQRLKQVLLNLVSNGIKYNRDGGSVDIRVQPAEGGRIAICITDTGRGIAAEDLERLFSPFERLGAEQSGVEGTGLGLALSRLMVEAMQGSLEVASVHGEGSTFTVELPAAPVPAGSRDKALAPAGR